MRKFMLMALSGAAIALAAPAVSSASPLVPTKGLATAAEKISATEAVHHRRWHRRHHRRWSRCG
jgi:hypothetical protein